MKRNWTAILAALTLATTAAWGARAEKEYNERAPEYGPRAEAAVARAEAAVTSGPTSKIKWRDSLDSALAAAKKQKRPVMAVFYTQWNQWWRNLEEKTLANDEVASLSRKLINVRIDAEKNKELVERYQIKGYPTILFFNARGQVIHRLTGFIPAEPFARQLEKIIGGREPLRKEFEQLRDSKPAEFRPLVQLGVLYMNQEKWDEAIDAYERALRVSPGAASREHQEVVFALVPLYDFRKQAAKSEPLLLELLKTNTADKIKVREMLGHVYLTLRQPEKAIEQFSAELQLVRDDAHRLLLQKTIDRIREAEARRPSNGENR
jgi:tetratricopeptide (TPR) repeat protein